MITLNDIRFHLRDRWEFALPVVDAIEARAAIYPDYLEDLELWLSGKKSTIHFHNNIAAPIRYLPQIIEIGKKFNPSTEWANTWMPLDTAMHLAKQAKLASPEEERAEMTTLPFFGMF